MEDAELYGGFEFEDADATQYADGSGGAAWGQAASGYSGYDAAASGTAGGTATSAQTAGSGGGSGAQSGGVAAADGSASASTDAATLAAAVDGPALAGLAVDDEEDDTGVHIFVEEAEDDGAARDTVEAVRGGRYMRVRRTKGTRTGAGPDGAAGPRVPRSSVFEEIGEAVPERVVLPDDEAVTIFEVPLYVYQSRPWDIVGTDVSAMRNVGNERATRCTNLDSPLSILAGERLLQLRNGRCSVDQIRLAAAPHPQRALDRAGGTKSSSGRAAGDRRDIGRKQQCLRE
jgi:hypothetical protein